MPKAIERFPDPGLKGRLAAEKNKQLKMRVAAAWTLAKTMLPTAPEKEQFKFAQNLLANSSQALKTALKQTAINAHYTRLATQVEAALKCELNDLLENPSILSKEEAAVTSELKGDPKNAAAKSADDRKECGPVPDKYPEPKRNEPDGMDGGHAADRPKEPAQKESTVNKKAKDCSDCKGCDECKPKKEAAAAAAKKAAPVVTSPGKVVPAAKAAVPKKAEDAKEDTKAKEKEKADDKKEAAKAAVKAAAKAAPKKAEAEAAKAEEPKKETEAEKTAKAAVAKAKAAVAAAKIAVAKAAVSKKAEGDDAPVEDAPPVDDAPVDDMPADDAPVDMDVPEGDLPAGDDEPVDDAAAEEPFDEEHADLTDAVEDIKADIETLETAIADFTDTPEDMTLAEGEVPPVDEPLPEEGLEGVDELVPEGGEEELNLEDIFNEDAMQDKVSSLNDEDDVLEAGVDDFFDYRPSDASELEAVLDREEGLSSPVDMSSPADMFALEGVNNDPLAALFASVKQASADVVEPGDLQSYFETDLKSDDRDSVNDHEGDIASDVFESLKQPVRTETRDTVPKLETPKAAGVIRRVKQAKPAVKEAGNNLAKLLFPDDPDTL